MLLYLLKSAVCMGLFLAFYKLLLEKESMHVYKRFFLLFAVIVSLVIPNLVLTEYVSIEPIENTVSQTQEYTDADYIGVPTNLENDVLDSALLLWFTYVIGLFFFGYKFFRNLTQIIRRIRKNPKQKALPFIQVLLKESYPPHTFFKYIFLNQEKFESKEIPEEVLLHEETHARQKHSLDVIFIELLQVIFWFNPLVFLFKRAIKLNHEFLADQAVLNKQIDQVTYQNTLLSYLSPDSKKKYHPVLVNAFNYSSIKKRFIVMKKQTSKKSILFKNLLLLPLLAILVFSFSESRLIEKEIPTDSIILNIEIKNKTDLWYNGEQIYLENLSTRLSQEISNRKDHDILNIHITSPKDLHSEFLNQLNTELQKLDPTQINVFSAKYIMPEDEYQNKVKTTPNTLRLQTQKLILKGKQKIQEGATKAQLKEYNDLAKAYNRKISKEKRIQIFKSDVDRLEYLYAIMTKEQKANAEPFPDFPEPPPAPAPPVIMKNSNLPPPPPIPADATEEQKAQYRKAIRNYENGNPGIVTEVTKNQKRVKSVRIVEDNEAIPPAPPKPPMIKKGEKSNIPPPPPPPKSPLDHVIEMAKKDAKFYHDGKKISSDKAIALLKKSSKINIQTKQKGLKTPIVELSTKPIVIKK